MKKIFIVAVLLLMASICSASPYLVCDPQSGVTHYQIIGLPFVSQIDAQADGSLKLDVALSPVGTNSVTVSACIEDATWGEVCGEASPFSYFRPLPPAITNNIRLTQ